MKSFHKPKENKTQPLSVNRKNPQKEIQAKDTELKTTYMTIPIFPVQKPSEGPAAWL